MESDPLAQRIVRFLRTRHYRPQSAKAIARTLGDGSEERERIEQACRALMKAGRIVSETGKTLTLPGPPGKVIGVYRSNPRGFGFIVPDEPIAVGDLYVPNGKNLGAMNGDTVAARVFKRGKRQGKMIYEARVTAIIERGLGRLVGELQKQHGQLFIIPDGKVAHGPVLVADAGAKNARPGDQVVVEITQYPIGQEPALGAITAVLGPAGQPDVDTQSIIAQYGLPDAFDESVLIEARSVAQQFQARTAAREREDLRTQTTITIDPVTARDFDDAISIQRRRDGTMELGVHIADVAHFVRPGSALDREAWQRANSIYLPRTVIPMLPETLSNGVCSLQEQRSRLTKSVFIRFDKEGCVQGSRVANTIIRSTKRLTYEQVDAVLDGKPGRLGAVVVRLLKQAELLARRIHARRMREGMLVLALPEVVLVHDEDGSVCAVEPASRSFSHTIIEMFMIEANEAVARQLHEKNIPFLRRIHEEGDDVGDGSLRRFLHVLGFSLPARADHAALQALLAEVAEKPESFAVNLAVLKSMQQAVYSPREMGHYALASEHYCHFTSPIRRYPDLTIHRLMDRYLCKSETGDASGQDALSIDEFVRLGTHCSERERRAESAERELTLVLTLRLLSGHLGESFMGVVTGVSNAGLFVQLEDFLIDGLLSYDELADDWWEVDPSRVAVVGRTSGRRIKVGARFKVVVADVDVAARRLDLALEAGSGGSNDRKSQLGPSRKGRQRLSGRASTADAKPDRKRKKNVRTRAKHGGPSKAKRRGGKKKR